MRGLLSRADLRGARRKRTDHGRALGVGRDVWAGRNPKRWPAASHPSRRRMARSPNSSGTSMMGCCSNRGVPTRSWVCSGAVKHDPPRFACYGRNARASYEERFDPDTNVQALIDIYEFGIRNPVKSSRFNSSLPHAAVEALDVGTLPGRALRTPAGSPLSGGPVRGNERRHKQGHGHRKIKEVARRVTETALGKRGDDAVDGGKKTTTARVGPRGLSSAITSKTPEPNR